MKRTLAHKQPRAIALPGHRKLLRTIFSTFCCLAFLGQQTYGQIQAGGFELDGNAVAVSPNPPDDWNLIYSGTNSASVTSGIVTDMPSSNDNAFTVGSKDQGDVTTWHWQTFSVPDKSDILHAGAALYSPDNLFFFGDRFSTSGSSQIGFWFFKNNVAPLTDGSFSGTHAVGDILLLSNFTQGGGTSTIQAFEWVGSGGDNGSLQSLNVSGINLFATVNTASQPSPWPFNPKSGPSGQFPTGAFYEGGIDLSGLTGVEPCFTSFMLETRSSSSITAELKDFIFGQFRVRPTVTVNSATTCGGGGPFTLTATVNGGIGPFSYTWSNGATSSSISVSPASTTIYTVTVGALNGCNAAPAPGTVTINPNPPCSISDISPQPLFIAHGNYTLGTTLSSALYDFSWSMSVDGNPPGWAIVGSHTMQNVTFSTALAGQAPFQIHFMLTATDKASGCSSTCTRDFSPGPIECSMDCRPSVVLNCNHTSQYLMAGYASDIFSPVYSWTRNGISLGAGLNDGVSLDSILVTLPGTYRFTCQDLIFPEISCYAEVTVTQNITSPGANATGGNLTCLVTTVQLVATPSTAGLTYAWSGPGGFTSSLRTPTVSASGTYTVTVTDPANGCTSTASASVTQNITPPNLNVSGGDITCFQPCVQLLANSTTGGVTFSWTGPHGFTSTQQSPTVCDSGNCTVTATDPSNGCTASGTARVNTVTPNASATCGSNGGITAGFELDGNAFATAPNPPDDWSLIYGSLGTETFTTGVIRDAPSNADNYSVGGSKDIGDITTWHYSIQTTPDKDDILHAGAAQYGAKLYFFGDRFAVNGNAQIGFWFFKNAVSLTSGGNFSGVHAIGDLLILSNFTNGGSNPVIFVYEWVGSGGSDETLNALPLSAASAYAIINGSSTASPWPFNPKSGPSGQFPAGAFYEGGVDLACLQGVDLCFASFMMETRSSQSVTAELKDFVMGNFFVNPTLRLAHKTDETADSPIALDRASETAGITLTAYPNPFSDVTTFEFTVPESGKANLEIFNSVGARVCSVFEKNVEANTSYQVDFNGKNLSKGVYIYRFTIGDKTYSRRLVIVR